MTDCGTDGIATEEKVAIEGGLQHVKMINPIAASTPPLCINDPVSSYTLNYIFISNQILSPRVKSRRPSLQLALMRSNIFPPNRPSPTPTTIAKTQQTQQVRWRKGEECHGNEQAYSRTFMNENLRMHLRSSHVCDQRRR